MIFNLSSGVGKFATIIVYCPTNTSIVCSKTPFSFSKTSGSSTSVTFEVPVSGQWTLTADRNGLTDTKTVSVPTQGQTYSVTMSLRYYLFKQGEGAKVAFTRHNATVDSNEIVLSPGSVSNQMGLATSNMIDLSAYRKVYFDAKGDGTADLLFAYKDSVPIYNQHAQIHLDIGNTRVQLSGNISSVTGSWYLGISYGSSGGCHVYNWYLEA